MASVLSGKGGLLLSLLFSHLRFSIGGLLKGSVTCTDCSPSLYDLSGVRLAVSCSKEGILAYALTDTKGQFQILNTKPSPLPPDCTVNLLGGKTQLCAHKKSIISKIIAINSLSKSSNSSYTLQTPLAFITSCKKIMERAELEKRNGTNYGGGAALGAEKSTEGGAPPPPDAESISLPPLIYVFPFFPIIGIP